jgi:hypothetical protein
MSNPMPKRPHPPKFDPSRRRGSGLAAAFTAFAWAVLLSLGGNAHAQPAANEGAEPVRFSLVRGDGAELCPGAQLIEQRVAANLGRSPFASDAPYELEGVVHHAGGGWSAVLRLRDRQGEILGERRLEDRADSCDAIARAVVLAIGLTIDPQAPLHTASPPTEAPAEHDSPAPTVTPALPASPPSSVSAGPPTPAPAPRSSVPPAEPAENGGQTPQNRPAVRIMPELVVAWGVLPGTAVGGGLSAVVFQGAHLSGGLGMLWLSEQRIEQGSFGFGLTAGTVQACYRLSLATRVDASSCAVAQAGAMHATAYADEPLDPGQKLWLAAGGGEHIALRVVDEVFLDVALDVLVPIVRRDFRLVGDDPHRIFLPPPVAAVGHVGIAVNFP